MVGGGSDEPMKASFSAGRSACDDTFLVPSGITLTASLPLTNWALAVVAASASAPSARR